MRQNPNGTTHGIAVLKSVLIIALFVGVLSVALFSMSLYPDQEVNDARASYAIEQNGSMTVEAYFYHNVDYLLVEGADGETNQLHGVGDEVNLEKADGAVNVYKVVNGETTHLQQFEYHEPYNQNDAGGSSDGGVTIDGVVVGE